MIELNRGLLAAIGALAVLGGVIGWRMMEAPESAPATGEADESSLPPTIEQLEAEAAANPDDAPAWQRLGLAMFQLNRFDEAVSAYERAVEIDTESALLWSSLGEARVMASRADPLPGPALDAFERALELDRTEPRARYFMAVRKDLAEDHEGAIADWLALLADTPPGAPWETDLVRTIQQVGAIHEIEVAARIEEAAGTRDILPSQALASGTAAGRGPTAEQMAAAASLSPAEQQDMAEGMVARLAARLEREPGDVDGWVMLMRSYLQLGRDGQARNARDRAIEANPQSRTEIEAAAAALGIA